MFRIWKCIDSDTELILLVNDMPEPNMKQRLQVYELVWMISLPWDKFVRSEKLEMLFCAKKKKFSFRWIEEFFVQVPPEENVGEIVVMWFKE